MDLARYQRVRRAVIDAGHKHEIDWAETVKPPETAEQFAREVIWVILCSGMKEQVARLIQDRVWAAINAGRPVKGNVLGASGKAAAVDSIWQNRAAMFAAFTAANDKVEFCQSIPWIGPITKWHAAKNLGVDCAKPDIHLERVAAFYETTPAELCAALWAASGDRIATVDLVIWRACNLGIIQSRDMVSSIANIDAVGETP
jgi:hypothetical protein